MNENEVTIIDVEGVHSGTIQGNTLTRTSNVADWTPFTHNLPKGEDWSRLYPYTAIAYQLGKRIYPEFVDPRNLMEHIENNDAYSIGIVVTPNGRPWTPAQFEEQYNKIVGLIVEAPDGSQ